MKRSKKAQKFDIGIRAKRFLSMSEKCIQNKSIESDIFIGISKDTISKICNWSPSLKRSCKKFLNLSDHLVMPGLVNAHTHLAMSLLRGTAGDEPFETWLFKNIIPTEEKWVSPEFVRNGAQLSLLEGISRGTTTYCDMYFYSHLILEEAFKAGVRGIFGVHISDMNKITNYQVNETPSILKKIKSITKNSDRVEYALAPHAPYTVSDALFQETTQMCEAQGLKLMLHLCETESEVKCSMQDFGKTPVKRLADLGVFKVKTIAAHGIYFSKQDLDILKNYNVSVSHCPDSNLILGSGIADIQALQSHDISIGIGTDGAASNNDQSMFLEINSGAKLFRFKNPQSTNSSWDFLKIATIGGAKALELGSTVGSLEVGKKADLIALNLNYPQLNPENDLVNNLVYAATGQEVELTMCDGKILYAFGEYKTLNMKKILAKAQKWKQKLNRNLNQ